MNYIPTAAPSPASQSAGMIVQSINRALEMRIRSHQQIWQMCWENHQATPQQVFAALGPAGYSVLEAGGRSIAELEAIATSKGVEVAALIGGEKYLTTRYPVSVSPEGVVTVVMPEIES